MEPLLDSHDALISAPDVLSTDLINASYDAQSKKIVAVFRDGKIARVAESEFEELATTTAAD